MAQGNWLDEDTYAPQDPWDTSPAPTQDPVAPDTSQAPPQGDWSAPQGGYASDLGQSTPQAHDPAQTAQAPAQAGVTGQGGTASAGGNVAQYQSYLDAVHGAADPQAKASAQDALARQLQQDLEADGHKVTWKGNVMMVDGRSYELAGEGVTASPTVSTHGTVPAGFDETKWNTPGYNDDKYTAGRIIAAGGSPADVAQAIGGTYLGGDWVRDRSGNTFDVSIDYGPGGQNAPQWAKQDFDAQGNWIPPNFNTGATAGNPNSFGFGGAGGVGGGDWMNLFRQASAETPFESQYGQFMSDWLAHPDTLSDRDVETLKAKDAEEAAGAAQLQDEELQHFGYGAGLDSSPWLAGQRSENQWNRRQATISSNRSVDIAAADRRSSDRQAAASAGAQWAQLSNTKRQQALSTAVDYLKTSLGYDVDLKKLSQADEQFQADLVYRIQSLKQADDQFKANYGLDSQKLSHTIDQDYWDRSHATYATPNA